MSTQTANSTKSDINRQPDLEERLIRLNSLLFDARSFASVIQKQIHYLNSTDPLKDNDAKNIPKQSPNGFLEAFDDKLFSLTEVTEMLRANKDKLTLLTGITGE